MIAADAERLADRHRELVAQLGRHGLAVHAPSLARHEERHVDRFLDVAARLVEDLPHLARHVARELSPCGRRSAARRGTASPRAAARARGASRHTRVGRRDRALGIIGASTPETRRSGRRGWRDCGFRRARPTTSGPASVNEVFENRLRRCSPGVHDFATRAATAISSRKPKRRCRGRAATFARSDAHPTHTRERGIQHLGNKRVTARGQACLRVATARTDAGKIAGICHSLRINKVIRSWHES
mgnify:CR=1 FL=1